MNKEVIYEKGIVYVKDENGNKREIVPLDNLDDILIQENIIELIEKVIKALEYSSATFQQNKTRDILTMPLPIAGTITLPIIMMYMNTGSLAGTIYTKFGYMDKQKFLALFIAAFLPIGYRMTKKWYKEYREEQRCQKGRQLALYELKRNIPIQKEKLDALIKSGKEIKVEDEKTYRVNHDEKVEIFQEHINLYYELGYNIKEYYEYFRINGCLPEDVRQDYNEEGIQIIEEYLKNNGDKIKKLK